jgi:hypothetical protein
VRLCILLAAWSVAGWLAVQVSDWRFAPSVPAAAVPASWLVWVTLAGCVALEAARRCRGASARAKVLALTAAPAALLLQAALVAGPVGPPTDFRLETEFRQERAAFDAIASMAGPGLAAFDRVEGDARSQTLSSRVAHLLQTRFADLRVAGIRQPGPCLEIVRWSAGSARSGLEAGFLYSVRPPHLLAVPIDRETFLRDGVREYHRLDAHWYFFRAAW